MPDPILGKAQGGQGINLTFMGWVLEMRFLTLPLQAVHFVAVEDPQHNTPLPGCFRRLWHCRDIGMLFWGRP